MATEEAPGAGAEDHSTGYIKAKAALRSAQALEVRAIEKELKKKKLPPATRTRLEEKLHETLQRHADDLHELGAKFGGGGDGSAEEAGGLAAPAAGGGSTAAGASAPPSVVFPSLSWNGLSKKELEAQAVIRGLSKKGSKEELTTRLVLFTNNQRARIDRGELDPEAVYVPKTAGRAAPAAAAAAVAAPAPAAASAAATAASAASAGGDRWKATDSFSASAPSKKKSKSASKKEKPPAAATEAGDESSEESGTEESGGEGGDAGPGAEQLLDIPDADMQLGSGKTDARGQQRRAARAEHGARGARGRGGGGAGGSRGGRSGREAAGSAAVRGGGAAGVAPAASAAAGAASAATGEEERQFKRELALRKVLAKILESHGRAGFPLASLETELQKFKVSNFSPQILGYDSVERWLRAQPADLLFFDEYKGRVYPSRRGEIPSEGEEEEGEGESSSGSSSEE